MPSLDPRGAQSLRLKYSKSKDDPHFGIVSRVIVGIHHSMGPVERGVERDTQGIPGVPCSLNPRIVGKYMYNTF